MSATKASAPDILPFADDTEQLVKEYADFVTSIEIDKEKPSIVQIVTKENVKLTVQISTDGWIIQKVDGQRVPRETQMLQGEYYEGPEALLMAASNEFMKLWHERLMDKLFALGGTLDHNDDQDDR